MPRLPLTRLRLLPYRLVQFALTQLACCAFPIAIFAGLAFSVLVWARMDMPLACYDALLIYVVAVQVVFVLFKLETWRELMVICAFHVIGLALKVFKVSIGSWAYPDAGVARFGGVPPFSGFMDASVGSYICQAFRRFDLRVGGFRWWPVSLLAVAAYANFFTHHWIPDVRVLVAVGFVVSLWGSAVHFRVGPDVYWMPTALAFVLIGTFLWLAEKLGHSVQRVALPRPGRRLADGARRQAGKLGAADLAEFRAGGCGQGEGRCAVWRRSRQHRAGEAADVVG